MHLVEEQRGQAYETRYPAVLWNGRDGDVAVVVEVERGHVVAADTGDRSMVQGPGWVVGPRHTDMSPQLEEQMGTHHTPHKQVGPA